MDFIELIITLILSPFLLYIYIGLWRNSRKHKSALQQLNRTVSLYEAIQRIERKEGIILVDYPTVGWGIARVWWSSRTDFVPQVQRDKYQTASKADIENYYRFIDSISGSACLVDGFVLWPKRYLTKHFGPVERLNIFSGGVLFDKMLNEESNSK